MSTNLAAPKPVVARAATAERLAHAQQSVMTLLADSSETGGQRARAGSEPTAAPVQGEFRAPVTGAAVAFRARGPAS